MSFFKALQRSQVQASLFSKRCLGTTPTPLGNHPPHKPVARPNLYEVLGKEEITLAEFKEHPAFNSWLKKAVHSLNFKEFTGVQQKTILPFLQEKGLVCRAKTGTGKTYSFVIPLVQHVMDIFEVSKSRRRNVSCLVIAPTRDLAQQIHADFRSINTNTSHLKNKCDVRLWTGGLPTGKRPWGSDVPQIIVGTPGRILANLEDSRWAQHFNELEYRVYDEADRLLDQGFEDQLNAIDDKLKSLRSKNFEPPLRTFLFSATTNERVTRFAEAQMGKDYKYINCIDDSVAESHAHIEQRLVKTQNIMESHVAAITEILANIEKPDYKAIFFLPTVVGADFMFRLLRSLLPSRFSGTWLLHGKMSMGARKNTTERFKSTKRGILICTDVAARGLDFKGVSDVIQMATTQNIEDYIHKIGRTGRAGQPGRATLFLSESELNFAKQLYVKKHIEFSSETTFEMTEEGAELLKGKASEEEIGDYVKSVMGFQSAVCDTYRMDKFDVIRSLISLYRTVIDDEQATVFLSTRMFNNMALPGTLVPDYVQVDNPNAIKRKAYPRVCNKYGGDRSDGGQRYGAKRFGGDREGGNRYGGDREGGNRYGGNREGGNRYGGNREGGNRYGGNREGGNRYGGDRDGGKRYGGDREGGNRYGGNREGGNRPGGYDRFGPTRYGGSRNVSNTGYKKFSGARDGNTGSED
ncbi:hypothetical protein JCM33374_g3169 [Metschnikowia sp. JCM 33374]|nr:hypothetical protein JCM33374_g3169 [Metschnikowia sp. JCM 33374]